jgi:hypothetical protein
VTARDSERRAYWQAEQRRAQARARAWEWASGLRRETYWRCWVLGAVVIGTWRWCVGDRGGREGWLLGEGELSQAAGEVKAGGAMVTAVNSARGVFTEIAVGRVDVSLSDAPHAITGGEE